ncbi:family 2A encapsulin nanocompartment cargo protein cysteine desulfurase [Nannocystaceae bacterium ST9]
MRLANEMFHDLTGAATRESLAALASPSPQKATEPSELPSALVGHAGLGELPGASPRLPGATSPSMIPAGVAAFGPSSLYVLAHANPVTPAISPVASPWTGPIPMAVPGRAPFDLDQVRRDFPILAERVQGKRLIWLDNAATTQKPRQVIDRLRHFYEHENSNIHRAAHTLAARSTDAYEGARERVRGFLGASSVDEIVFVRGATEAINLVAESWGRANLRAGDEIVLSLLEHHANIVPWQHVAAATGAKLVVIPVDDRGQIRLDEYARLLGPKTKLVSFTQVSNALGTVTPVQAMVAMARGVGAKVLVDGAQAVSHMPVDVRAIGSDWYVFSGHKVFAPTGIGVLWGTRAILDEMPPWQGGGNMIADVSFERTRYQPPPHKFEAGTGNIADAVGLGAAIDYLGTIGMANIAAYEHQLLDYGTRLLREVPGLRLIGTAEAKAGVLSFVLDGIDDREVGKALDEQGIAVRAGHHCAQPILRRFGLESTLRPSLAFYNTCGELEALAGALHRIAARRPGRR